MRCLSHAASDSIVTVPPTLAKVDWEDNYARSYEVFPNRLGENDAD